MSLRCTELTDEVTEQHFLACSLLAPPAPPANAAVPGEESIYEHGVLTYGREHGPTGDVKLLEGILKRNHAQIYPNEVGDDSVHVLLSLIKTVQLLMVIKYLYPFFQRGFQSSQLNCSCQTAHFPPTSYPLSTFFLPSFKLDAQSPDENVWKALKKKLELKMLNSVNTLK